MLLISSCARQRYVGQHDFAQRFNQGSQSVKITEDGYYEKDNEFNFFAKGENLRQILISLKQNEKLYVTSAKVTVIKSSENLSDLEKEELMKTVVSILSVICNTKEDEILNNLSEINFEQSKFDFVKNTESFEIMNADCFFYSNSEMIFFNVQIK